MRIALVTETLHVGGAETFVVRLANALVKHHAVAVINLYPELSKKQLVESLLSGNITVVNVMFPAKRIFRKLDALLYHCRIDFSFVEYFFQKKLNEFVRDWSPDVIHSNLFKPDYYISLLKKKTKGKFHHVITNHGDYLLFESTNPVRLLNYQKKLQFVLSSIDQAVVISDEQFRWMREVRERAKYTFGVQKILNGYAKVEMNETDPTVRQRIGICEGDFVFGMVARGFKEKGWHSLIRAFQSLSFINTKLVLIGAGEEIDLLKSNYKSDSRIIFTGYCPNPLEYIQVFDVGILPSFYQAESLPTVIIEYLLRKKPIIATDIGEVKNMLATPTGEISGILIKQSQEGVDEAGLSQAMKTLFIDREVTSKLSNLAEAAFQKFDMDKCVLSYLKIYEGK